MSVKEARIALDCGADLIDFKDPTAGALGALPDDVIRAGVRMVGGRGETSATIGDLPMLPEVLARRVQEVAGCRVDYVKVGFFPAPCWDKCIAALAQFSQRIRLIAVLFADRAPDFDWATKFARAGWSGVMLDTADKNTGNLRRQMSDAQLGAFIAQAHARGLLAGLAGSLRAEDIPDLVKLRPDYLGFRGALCGGGRAEALEPEKVSTLLLRMRASYNESSGLSTPRPPRLSTCV
jgi:dihydroneopterin aldolase